MPGAALPWEGLGSEDFRDAGPLQRAVRRLGAYRPASWVLARVLHHLDRPVSRATGGRHTLTSLLTGVSVAMLTTTGARSGLPRCVPVLGFPAEGGLVVIASNFGQQRHPAWFHNLRAEPQAEVLLRGVRVPVVARLTAGEQRERIWARALAIYPGWAEYRSRVPQRDIGVFLLSAAQR